jgi:hypothetical protein
MQGLQVFFTLEDAIRNGFSVYDRTPTGYIVHAKTSNGWALALVQPRKL